MPLKAVRLATAELVQPARVADVHCARTREQSPDTWRPPAKKCNETSAENSQLQRHPRSGQSIKEKVCSYHAASPARALPEGWTPMRTAV
eukprot:6172331-Prymnesium_polylepis.1